MDGGRRFLRSLKEQLGALLAPTRLRAAAAFAGDAATPSIFAASGPEPRAAAKTVPPKRKSSAPSGKTTALDRMSAIAATPGLEALVLATMVGACGWTGFVQSGGYAQLVEESGAPRDIVARALGFPIKAVTISGQARLREPEILAAAGIDPRASLIFLDAAEIRHKLGALALVQDARVLKLYPDRLVINIVEREAAALWQRDGAISVIAADGTVIDQLNDRRFLGLPFVVGEGADKRLPEYVALLADLGDLAARVKAGVLVAGRRWSLTLVNGVEIKLPERDPGSAIGALTRLQREARILDKDIISIQSAPARSRRRATDRGRRGEFGGRIGAQVSKEWRSDMRHSVPMRMKQLQPRRAATVAALDVGTSKIACIIARLTPQRDRAPDDWRTHKTQILGVGHQRSRGVKNGLIVDMDEAESAIRQTVDAAERMAGVRIDRVVVTAAGGRLASQHFAAKVTIGGREVADYDVHRVLEASANYPLVRGRVVLHSLPTNYSLDGVSGLREPRNMIGDELGVDLHVASCDQAAARNLTLAAERGHLSIEAAVAAPYAAGLCVLEPDEAEMGVAVVDMGAGTTSLAIFAGGALAHLDAVSVGGNHVTMDIARVLNARLADAERLKTFHGAAIASPCDDRESVSYAHVGELGEHQTQAPRSHLVRVIRPRVEETMEFLRDRLAKAGYGAGAGRRVVLTGGACQLTGAAEAARRILGGQVRVGRPLGVVGLPEAACGPAFAAALGLFVYPQVAGREYFEPNRERRRATGSDGYMSRMGRWLVESF